MVARLSVMMFIQFFCLSAWIITIATYIKENTSPSGDAIFEPGFIGFSATTAAIGSLLSPILLGMVSDKYLSAEKILLLLNLACGLITWFMYDDMCNTQSEFYWGMFFYFQCYVPLITLGNAVAFRHLKDVDKEFSIVRVFGTVGWIAAGLFVGWFWPTFVGEEIESTRVPLAIGAVTHGIMLLYCLTLPKTPPVKKELSNADSKEESQEAGPSLMKNRIFLFFLFFSLLACLPSIAYTNYANPFLNDLKFQSPAAILTLGQLSEVICLMCMATIISKIGLKKLMLIGMLSWSVRYLLLAWGTSSGLAFPVYLSILIHGPCFAFIYVAGQIYIDQLASKQNRGAAQGWLSFATTGVGHILGALLCGGLERSYLSSASDQQGGDWMTFWLVPAGLYFITALLFQIAFKDPRKQAELHASDLPPSPNDPLGPPPHA